MIVSIISSCLLPIVLYITIKYLYVVIHGALMDVNMAPPDVEKLAPQLEEWLSAQPHAAYDAITLGEIFGVSNRAVNGSMTTLLRKDAAEYKVIDGIKYYYYRKS